MESDEDGAQMQALVTIEPSTESARFNHLNNSTNRTTGTDRLRNPNDNIPIDTTGTV